MHQMIAHMLHIEYNPKIYLLFNSQEDYNAMRTLKNHYYYIEVDLANMLDEYHIMLCCDRMSNPEDKSIECFNSDYPIVMLREIGTDKIVGILKRADSEVFKVNDEHKL